MEIKKTLPISLILHVALISAAFLLAAGSGGRYDERVFFVNLTLNQGDLVSEKEVFRAEGTDPKTPPAAKNISNVTEESDMNKHDIRREEELVAEGYERNVEENDAVKKPLSSDSEVKREYPVLKAEGDGGVKQESPGDALFAMSHPAPSNGVNGVSDTRRRGVLPAGIIERIGEAIESAKRYPALARRRGYEGTVYVGFRISPEGLPKDIIVVKSSGYIVLDTATLNVVKRAAPYPYIDSGIEVPVTYKLKD